jgi:uncharacterized protein (DUF1810 family)
MAPRGDIWMNNPDQSLDRFLQAQEYAYEGALAELRAGRKRGHWMWYVLPQLRGLGYSQMSWKYGLSGQSEALDYFRHPILGPRLVECVTAVLTHSDRGATDILGGIDAVKFRSCLTLFATVAPEEPCFQAALEAFYHGAPDPETLKLLGFSPKQDVSLVSHRSSVENH